MRRSLSRFCAVILVLVTWRADLCAETTPAPISDLESAALSIEAEWQVSQQLEALLLSFVQVFDEQLSLEAAGKKELSRRYTEQELRDLVVRRLQERFYDRISDLDLNIHPDRLVAFGNLRMESRKYRVEIQLGLDAVNDRPYTEIHQVRIESYTLSQQNRELLQARVNGQIQRLRLSLKMKEISLKEGWAFITATLTG